MTGRATAVYVAYGVTELDLSWLPAAAPVVVVHNDDLLSDEACRHRRIEHLRPVRNIGFGAGVNEALWSVRTERVILCNPDTRLRPAHYRALAEADPDEIVAVPLIDGDGVPNAVVSPYFGPVTFMATALRLGRVAPRGGRLRSALSRLLGRWGAGHREAMRNCARTWSVTERWVSGAVVSLPLDALMAVGGFDERYFLYFEDVDLHQRLAGLFPEMTVRMAAVEPARHWVGGSVRDPAQGRAVAGHRRASARTYASRQSGVRWRVAGALVSVGAR